MQKHYCLRVKTGQMSKLTLTGEQVAEVMAHAASRGMTFEEYIQEYAELLQEEKRKKQEK